MFEDMKQYNFILLDIVLTALLSFNILIFNIYILYLCIRLSEKFLSFYDEIIDAYFLFYIILSNYVRSILSC